MPSLNSQKIITIANGPAGGKIDIPAFNFPSAPGQFSLNLPRSTIQSGLCWSTIGTQAPTIFKGDSDIEKSIKSAAVIVSKTAKVLGSEACAKVDGLTKDGVDQTAAFRMILSYDFLNFAKLDFNVPPINIPTDDTLKNNIKTLVNAVAPNLVTQVRSGSIDVGLEITKFIKSKTGGRRELADSVPVDETGAFQFGATTNGASAISTSLFLFSIVVAFAGLL